MNGVLEPDLFIYKQTGQALTTTKRWPSTHPEQFTTHTDHSYHYCCQLGCMAGYVYKLNCSFGCWSWLQIYLELKCMLYLKNPHACTCTHDLVPLQHCLSILVSMCVCVCVAIVKYTCTYWSGSGIPVPHRYLKLEGGREGGRKREREKRLKILQL